MRGSVRGAPRRGRSRAGYTNSSPPYRDADAPLSIWRLLPFILFYGGAEELHWSFLRGALWEILLTSPLTIELPFYWAVWIAAGIVVVELALRRLHAEEWLVYLVVLATSSTLFLFTRNFWLCWILHSTALLILLPALRTPIALLDFRQRTSS